MCLLHLTHPSAHTPGAVGSRHCGARGAVGGSLPCSNIRFSFIIHLLVGGGLKYSFFVYYSFIRLL